jgi:hypothetical protein
VTPETTHEIIFGVRRSVRYHNRRRAFFDGWVLITNAVSVIFGSAAMWVFWSKANLDWGVYAALIVTFFSAINLVVGAGQRARLHADLARRFFSLEKEIISMADPTEEQRRLLMGKRLEIEADEPPVLRVVDVMCHNELADAMGFDRPKDFYTIPWYLYLTGHFTNWFEGRIIRSDAKLKPKATESAG